MPASHHRNFSSLALAGIAVLSLLFGSGSAGAPDREGPLAACLRAADEPTPGAALKRPADPVQQALVEHLSRRFAIAAEATAHMVDAAHRAAMEVGLDPLLVLAVISIESRFNPIAESHRGAKGLMQIIPKYHRARFIELGGEDAVLDPESNIQVGARILQEYVYRTGTLEAGLQFYNGAMSDGSAQYAQKVMAERGRLDQVVRSLRHSSAAATTDLKGS
jgi:soluble lytic murein transglycosylase-like protein